MQKSPLNRYSLVKRPLPNFYIRVIDAFLKFLPKRSNLLSHKFVANKILISNGAHLGDLLVTMYLISAIKARYPDAKIGLLVGSWSLPLVKMDSRVDFIHVIDHWKLNRSNLNIIKKIKKYIVDIVRSLPDMVSHKYDVGIDAYYYYPNNIDILYLAGIPVRIGFISGGFGPLLTHKYIWEYKLCHVLEYEYVLLGPLGINHSNKCHLKSPFYGHNFDIPLALSNKITPKGYIVIHPGCGSPSREWSNSNWEQLINLIKDWNYKIVFTGSGQRDFTNSNEIVRNHSFVINTINLLKFSEFVSVIANAKLVVGVESFAGHLANSLNVPSVIIKSGTTCDHHWRPYKHIGSILRHETDCSPCHNGRGCKDMFCIKLVTPAEVCHAIKCIINE